MLFVPQKSQLSHELQVDQAHHRKHSYAGDRTWKQLLWMAKVYTMEWDNVN